MVPAVLLLYPFIQSAKPVRVNSCTGAHRSTVQGVVDDPTGALIPGATVTLDRKQVVSGADGSFRFGCVNQGKQIVIAHAQGFADSFRSVVLTTLRTYPYHTLACSHTDRRRGNRGCPKCRCSPPSISGDALQTLADDPDDLLRQLQQLGAATGGSPVNTLITVNGFQGSSKLPPKNAIAYIEVDPDLYSAEYPYPPYSGGRVNVFTKAGEKTFHGALFATNGSPWENARDPFSPGKASLGKQRYGFELTGPVRKKGSDFALDTEHRAIDNYAVVNAVTLNAAGSEVTSIANVATPQSLWEGEARLDWQLGSRNNFVATFSSNVNGLQNLGVGGTMLAETGYNSNQHDHVLRFLDLTTFSQYLVHEARLSLRWNGEDDSPVSEAPQINVAGNFTGGGTTTGPLKRREFNLEADDDAILSTKGHTVKLGTQFMLFAENQHLTNNFNGTYTFGGGTVPALDSNNIPIPGATQVISGIEQYRRTLLRLPGGVPTAFSNVNGDPLVLFTQLQDALYVQDDMNLGHGVHLQCGLRYALQNNPTTINAITPRLGILWSPKHSRVTLHARIGMFASAFKASDEAEVMREDGVHRITSTVYNPTYGDPFSSGTPIHSARRFSPHISSSNNVSQEEGVSYDLGLGFHISARPTAPTGCGMTCAQRTSTPP